MLSSHKASASARSLTADDRWSERARREGGWVNERSTGQSAGQVSAFGAAIATPVSGGDQSQARLPEYSCQQSTMQCARRRCGRGIDFEHLASVLSPREIEVLQRLAGGLRNAEIAQALFLTRNTVKYHLKHMFQILGVRSRSELIARALSAGMTVRNDDREHLDRLGNSKQRTERNRSCGEHRQLPFEETCPRGAQHGFSGKSRRGTIMSLPAPSAQLMVVSMAFHNTSNRQDAALEHLSLILSSREIEVLGLLGEGMKDTEIAGALFVTTNTVKYHLKQMFQTMGVKSRSELLAKAYG